MARGIQLQLKDDVKPTDVEDKWNFWVFNVSVDSELRGEEQKKSTQLSGNVSVNRVTLDSKLRLGLDIDSEKDTYELEDETISSTSDSKDFDGLYVKSISDHWSVGGWGLGVGLFLYIQEYRIFLFNPPRHRIQFFSLLPIYTETAARTLQGRVRLLSLPGNHSF